MAKQQKLSLQMISNAFFEMLRLSRTLFVSACLLAVLLADGFAYNYTANSADRSLKSDFKVDPATLAMSFEIPLGAYPNRGGGSLPISITYSSKLWRTIASMSDNQGNNNNHLNYYAYYGEDGSAGWTSSLEPPVIDFSTDAFDGVSGGSPGEISQTVGYIARLTVTLGDGSGHELRKDDVVHSSMGQTGIYTAVDGTGMKYDADNKVLYMTDGGRYFYQEQLVGGVGKLLATKFVDVNGNKLAYNSATRTWTDTLGRSIGNPLPAPREKNYGESGAGIAKGDYTYSLPGLAGGGNLQYTLKWRQLIDPQTSASIMSPDANGTARVLHYSEDRICKTDFSVIVVTPHLFDSDAADRLCAGTSQGSEELFNPVVLAEIVLPDGRSYSFKYNQYGEIDKVTYPTGATERFEYANVKALDPGGANFAENRGVVKRLVSPTGQTSDEQQWTYSNDYTNPAVSGSYFSRAVAPDGTFTAYRFNANQANKPFGFGSAKVGKLIEAASFTANGEILSRTLTDYYEDAAAFYSPNYAAYRDARQVREINIVFENGAAQALASQSVYEYDANSNPDYRAQLNPKRIKTYGFVAVALSNAKNDSVSTLAGAFSAAAPVKTAETDYLYSADYLARNMTTLASEIRVLDANNAVRSKSQIFYDEALYAPIGYGIAPGGWENPGTLKRGQATTTRSFYDIAANLSVETHMQADQFGQPRRMWDGRGNLSQTEYDQTYNTFPVKSITPKPDPGGTSGASAELETLTSYDPNTGLTLSVTDANGQTTAMSYVDPVTNQIDPLLRIRKVTAPNGQQTITEYGAGTSAATNYVKVKTQIDETKWKEGYTWFDGLGRTVKSQSVDSLGDVFVETEYDNMGRVKRISNPYRTGETIYKTENYYDSLGRIIKAKTPDGAEVLTSYDLAISGSSIGTILTVTDQAGKPKRSITNALAQLIRVDEPDGSGNLGSVNSPAQPTFYKYNTLGKMIEVTQGIQQRHFLYDGAGRLLRVRQPEQQINPALNLSSSETANTQWTVGFTYDANDNLLTTTDAKNVTTTVSYDALDRIKTRSYSDAVTPAVNFTYDDPNVPFSKGRLTKIVSTISETRYKIYDAMGRLASSEQAIDGRIFPTSYKYNLAGTLTEETYPSGRTVKNFLEADGDLASISSRTATGQFKTYASNFAYTASGVIERLQIGSGLWESAKMNSRNQVTELRLGNSPSDASLWKLNYDYGELNTNGTVDATKNSGNIAKQTVNFTGLSQPFVQTYKYDSLDRITEAKEMSGSSQTWKQTFAYDRYGNRTAFSQNILGRQMAVNNQTLPSVDQNTNRIQTGQGYQYDANGNLIKDFAGRQFTFDGDNKQTIVKDSQNQIVGRYYYDGNGKRVKKVTNLETIIFVYDGAGKLVAEYSTATSPQNPTTNYTATDTLGSPRVITNSRKEIVSRRDFMPFGEEITPDSTYRTANLKYGTGDNIRQKFTGYQRDEETNLDFAEARYYNNLHGRFTAVDPLLASGKSANPQTFNRYAYTMNRPLILTDPTGLQDCEANKPCKEIPPPPKIEIKVTMTKDGKTTERPLTELEQKAVDKLVAGNWKIIYDMALNSASRSNLPPTEVTSISTGQGQSTDVGVELSKDPNVSVRSNNSTNESTTSSAVPSLEDKLNANKNYLNNNAIFVSEVEKLGSVDNASSGAAVVNGQLRREATRLIEGANQSPRLPDEEYRRQENYRTNQGIRPPRVGPYPVYNPIPKP